MDYPEGYKTVFQKLANSEGVGLQGLDDLTWNDPEVNEDEDRNEVSEDKDEETEPIAH